MKKIISIINIIFISFSIGVARQFEMPITVSDGSNSASLTIGVHPEGSDGYDQELDVLCPPSPPSGHFDARLVMQFEHYLKDIRQTTQTEKTFTMEYAESAGASTITVTWDAECLNRLGQFTITDAITGTSVSMDMAGLNGQLEINMQSGSDDILRYGLRIIMTLDEAQLITVAEPIPDQNVFVDFDPYITADLDEVFASDFAIEEPFSYSVVTDGNVIAHINENLLELIPNTGFEGISEIAVSAEMCHFSVYDTFLVFVEETNGWIEEEVIQGSDTQLEQNYPNPFRGETIITYHLPKPGKVDMAVFDITGRKVKTLVLDNAGKGTYQKKWDRKNDSGDFVKKGLYICRLKVYNTTYFRKMTALKQVK